MNIFSYTPARDIRIVEITTNNVDYTHDAVQFEYKVQAIVTGISPNFGPLTGGTVVVVSGIDFPESQELQCRFVTFGMNLKFERQRSNYWNTIYIGNGVKSTSATHDGSPINDNGYSSVSSTSSDSAEDDFDDENEQ